MSAGGRKIWVSGQLCSEEDTGITPFDRSFLVGEGVFETLVAHDGDVFAFRRHYERLLLSAEVFGLSVPEIEVLREACAEVAEANDLPDARVRITVTAGNSGPGLLARDAGSETVVVAAVPLPSWGVTADVITVPFCLNERGALAGIKSTSYGENTVAVNYAARRGGTEAIFANTVGDLCEGAGSNIFLVIEGELYTPPLTSGCLAGVTRALVLELCADLGIGVFEQTIPVAALVDAEEAFLTSSTRAVQAIARVDGRSLDRVPGPVTRQVGEAYRHLVARDKDP